MNPFAKLQIAALISSVGLALAGCMTILDTSELYENGEPCTITTGAYHLPKRLVKATVFLEGVTDGEATNPRYDLKIDEPLIAAADTSEIYCLDYLSNRFAEDHVGIERTPDGLLKRVFTRAVDRSADIAIALIEGFGRGAAGGAARALLNKRLRGEGDEVLVGEYEFDPFDHADMRDVNKALELAGYCIFLDARHDPYVPRWSGEQCGLQGARRDKGWDPVAVEYYEEERTSDRSSRTASRRSASTGILYRPNITHSLVVLKRQDPDADEPWHLDTIRRIEMPNAAPTFAVQVERSWFVERTTDLKFDNGVLTDVSIEKKSEINAFMNIPLAAAQVIVSIPTQIVKIRINTANNQQALINANAQLIKAIREQECAVDKTKCEGAAPSPGLSYIPTTASGTTLLPNTSLAVQQTPRTLGTGSQSGVEFTGLDQCVEQCQIEGGEAECRTYCSCRTLCVGGGDVTSCRSRCARDSIGSQ